MTFPHIGQLGANLGHLSLGEIGPLDQGDDKMEMTSWGCFMGMT